MFKDVWDTKLKQYSLRQRFDIGAVSGAALVAYVARFKTMIHSVQGGAAVAATLSVPSDQILLHDSLLSAVSTGDGDPVRLKRSVVAIQRTILCIISACGIHFKRFAALNTKAGCLIFAAFHRAIDPSLRLTRLDGKMLAAFWADLFKLLALAFVGTKPTALTWKKLVGLSASFAVDDFCFGLIALPGTVARSKGFVWLASERLAAPVASELYEGVLSILGTFRSWHVRIIPRVRYEGNL